MSGQHHPFGSDLFGEAIRPDAPSGPVTARFVLPPFSLLDARTGEWKARKRAWMEAGIKSELGRTKDLMFGDGLRSFVENGTSVFDPALCEIMYRWFCPAGGQVVDPFAGGSVRGIVAGALGLRYWGSDLSAAQVLANREQADDIKPAVPPAWVIGDSLDTLDDAPRADLVFSCPPYGDLERYSDDPKDLSTMEWHTFVATYKRIVLRAVKCMKPNTFAVFVVGDFRDERGYCRNFIAVTTSAFEEAGAKLYNEAILATPTGSAAMRVTRQFNGGRKLVKVHQHVLVFCKGDWRIAAAKCLNPEVRA